MQNASHIEGEIHSDWGRLSAAKWRDSIEAANKHGLWHDGTPSGRNCPRCNFLNGWSAAVLNERETPSRGGGA